MCNNEATAHGKLHLRSLPICWGIILGGYLLIRMVFLIFGLQLHLTTQGGCLVLLPYCFGVLYLWKRCKNRKPLFPMAMARLLLFPSASILKSINNGTNQI